MEVAAIDQDAADDDDAVPIRFKACRGHENQAPGHIGPQLRVDHMTRATKGP